MITYLAEKRDQGIAYYMALAADNTLSATQLDEKYKKQGYIQFKNAAYHNGELITIIWAQGHMLELKEPEDYKADWKEWRWDTLPIIPEKFEYKVMTQKEWQFKKVKDFFEKSRMIVWATDIDREGSHIAYSISLMTGILDQEGPKKNIKSLWVDELTPTKIQEGVKKLREIDYRVLQAIEAQTRAIADWLLGMNASRALSLLLEDKIGLKLDRSGKDGKIAVGRIKTVALFLIYLRELAIRDFVPTTYWELEATFEHPNGIYKGNYIPLDIPYSKGDKKGEPWEGDCPTREDWEKLIQNPKIIGDSNKGVIVEHEVELKEKRPPRLYCLDSIQEELGKLLGLTAKEVLEGPCQELYEVRKLITYPRSLSFYISRERYETLRQQAPALARLVGFSEEDLVFPERPDGFFVNDKKAANHSAVVPTTVIPTEEEVEGLPDTLKIVYKAVIRRTLTMFFPKYQYEQTTIITQVGAGRFRTVGQVPQNPGWQVLFQDSASLLDGVIEESEARELIKVQINDTVTSHLVPAERHVKKTPRHTNSTWLRAMRTAGRDLDDEELIAIMKQIKGLGTAATRGAILDEIVVNKWVIVKQGKIYLSELGWLICETLKDERVLSQPETTAIWEQSLSKIAEGTNTQEKFLKNIYRYLGIENPHNNLIENLINAVDRTDYTPFQDFIEQAVAKADGKLGNCPLCGKAVKVLGKSKVAQCEDNILSKEERESGATPVCSFNFWITVGFIKDKKKTLTKKQISDLLSDKGRTNLIKNIEGKYGPFDAYAYLFFNEEKGIYQVNLEVDKTTSKK